MKTNRTKTKLPPANFWKLRRDRKEHRKDARRIEVQGVGLSANGELVCAGVHWVSELSARSCYRIAHNLKRWRKWYDSRPWNALEVYPAKNDKPIALYYIHPINEPSNAVFARVP